MTKFQKTILFLLTLTALCILGSLFLVSIPANREISPTDPAGPARPQPSPTTPPQVDALQHQGVRSIYQCRQFVRDRLVSPSSAKFSYEEAYKVNDEPLNYHAVTGIVESQNRMGVPLQSEYRCDVHYLPDQPGVWVLDYLKIED